MPLRAHAWSPPPALRAHVAGVWRMTGDGGFSDWLLPDVGGADIAIQLAGPLRLRDASTPSRLVVGGLSRALVAGHAPLLDTVGLQLAPGCACLLGVPAAALRDQVLALGDVAPRLDRALAEWAERGAPVAELTQILATHVQPRCDAVATHAARALRDGGATVESIAREVDLSRRQLTRRFQSAVGVTPRQFLRIGRFARAWRVAADGSPETWAAVAAEAGYADQPHLDRDFRALVGAPPSRVFGPDWYARIGMSPPFKPAA